MVQWTSSHAAMSANPSQGSCPSPYGDLPTASMGGFAYGLCPFRHTLHTDGVPWGAPFWALVDGFACGFPLIPAHPSHGSCPISNYIYGWGISSLSPLPGRAGSGDWRRGADNASCLPFSLRGPPAYRPALSLTPRSLSLSASPFPLPSPASPPCGVSAPRPARDGEGGGGLGRARCPFPPFLPTGRPPAFPFSCGRGPPRLQAPGACGGAGGLSGWLSPMGTSWAPRALGGCAEVSPCARPWAPRALGGCVEVSPGACPRPSVGWRLVGASCAGWL